MNSRIRIGNKIFRHVNSISVNSSRKNLTDTAIINLPNILELKNNPIKIGEAVEISFGYDNKINNEFFGYVTEVKSNSPLEIRCEDEMWQLKQQKITKSWESITLENVLKFIYPKITLIECPELNLSSFRLVDVTKSKALEMIKEDYGLDIYFRDKKLFAGLAYTEKGGKTVKYHFQKNIPSRVLQPGLIYKTIDSLKIKIDAVSMLSDNKKITVSVGENGGDTYTRHFYNLNKDELKIQAEIALKKMNQNNLSGELLSFFIPIVKHGDIAQIIDNDIKHNNGSYFVDSVSSRYGIDGIRRNVVFGSKVS